MQKCIHRRKCSDQKLLLPNQYVTHAECGQLIYEFQKDCQVTTSGKFILTLSETLSKTKKTRKCCLL